MDGDITLDVIAQINELPTSATHLVISVGGNDALQNIGIVNESVKTVGEALLLLNHIREAFRRDYRLMLQHVLSFELPVAVCTIYNTIPGLDGATKTALALFNEIILQEAAMAKVPVIDLRIICNEHSDYSAISPIEPSDAGGHKISQAIHALLESGNFVVNPNDVYFEATYPPIDSQSELSDTQTTYKNDKPTKIIPINIIFQDGYIEHMEVIEIAPGHYRRQDFKYFPEMNYGIYWGDEFEASKISNSSYQLTRLIKPGSMVHLLFPLGLFCPPATPTADTALMTSAFDGLSNTLDSKRPAHPPQTTCYLW
jgi:hypothetical protein